MELQNETPFAALPLRLELTDTQIQGVLVVKSTFVREKTRWVPAPEQVPMIGDKLETEFGVFHSDGFVHKEGIDVCVLGTVRSSRPERMVELDLQIEKEQRTLRVYGDRTWLRRGSQLLPSDPQPFEEMPLAYARAYGGTTEHDYETYVHPDNPVGRGYYLSETAAEGQPLANVEDGQGTPVARWNDQPTIAGWAPYPQFWGLRAREGVIPQSDPSQQLLPRLLPRLNNNAHSSLVFPSLSAQAPITIRGMRPEQVVIEPPRLALHGELVVGERVTPVVGQLDGIHCWVDAERITLTHRLHYRYLYQKEERRRLRLTYELRS